MLSKLSSKLLSRVYWALVIVLVGLIIVIQGHIALNYTVILMLFVVGGLTWKVKQTLTCRYREYLFKPLSAKKHRRATRRFFDRNSDLLQQVGFKVLGDYLLLPDPNRLVARFLLSPGGQGIADVTEREGALSYSFTSVASDGTFLESSSLQFETSPSGSEQLHFQSVDPFSPIEALRQHQQWVRQYEEEQDAKMLTIAADQFQEFVDYGNRLVGHDLYQQGHFTTDPSSTAATAPFRPSENRRAILPP